MHVFLAMSESLLTWLFKKHSNKKMWEKFSFHVFFKHKTSKWKWRIGLHSNVGKLCEQLCPLASGFHAICLASLHDHQLYTTLKINESSCNIRCVSSRRPTHDGDIIGISERGCVTDLKASGFSLKLSHLRFLKKSRKTAVY